MDFGPHLMLASIEGAVISAILVLTAVGLSIVFGVMRVVNVAHGEFFMLGAVLAWAVTVTIGGHPALGSACHRAGSGWMHCGWRRQIDSETDQL